MKVVDYLKKRLGTQKQCAKIFDLTEHSVKRIWNKYNEKGKWGLASKKRGVREDKKINGKQAEVRNLIKDKMPDQLRSPSDYRQEKLFSS